MRKYYEEYILNNINFDKIEKKEIEDQINKNIINKSYLEMIVDIKKGNFERIKNQNDYIYISYKKNNGFILINKKKTVSNIELASYRIMEMLKNQRIEMIKVKNKDNENILIFNNTSEITEQEKHIIKNKLDFVAYMEKKLSNDYIENIIISMLLDCMNTTICKINGKELMILNFQKKGKCNFLGLLIDYENLIEWLFEEYFYEIINVLYKYINNDILDKILSIYKFYLNEKEYEKMQFKLKGIFQKLKKLIDIKTMKLFKDYNFTNLDNLLDYMSSNFEYGTIVNLFGNNEIIPFGTLESIETIENKNINFENKKIINLINKYYKKNEKEINSDKLNITQFVKNITTLSLLIKKEYIPNNPIINLKYKVANSFERVRIIELYLKSNNINYKKFAFSEIHNVSFNETRLTDTQFIIFAYIDNKWCYIEIALNSFKGVYKFDDYDEMITTVISKIIYFRERNSSKNIPLGKYSLCDITKINTINYYDNIINDISKNTDININKILKRYKIENELRKKIILHEINVYINNEIVIIDNNSLDLLSENAMNLVYEDKDELGKFYIIKQDIKHYIQTNNKKTIEINIRLFKVLLLIILISLLIFYITIH